MARVLGWTGWLATMSLLANIVHGKTISDVDWRSEYTSDVGDQGSCGGASTSFAIVEALEQYAGSITGQLVPLSTQYLVDCGVDGETGDGINRCDGDFVNSGLKQIMGEQYIPYDEDYSYMGNFEQGRCNDAGARDKLLRNAFADVWLHDFVPLSDEPEAIREALQTGPTIHTMYVGDNVYEWSGNDIVSDDGENGCTQKPSLYDMAFVGWQSNNGNPYYIARTSLGETVGDNGYVKYADNSANINCRYTSKAYGLVVGKRRELEYRLGEGKLTFVDSRQWCQGQGDGWDLAHIPTEMHNFEVYDMFTEEYGSDKKNDDDFNYFWIGLFDTRKGEGDVINKWVWVSGDPELATNEIPGTDIQYYNFASYNHKTRYGVMKKVNAGLERQRGSWTDLPAGRELRFVCSRYREESCPRISQTAIKNAYKVTFLSPEDGSETLEIVEGTRAKVTCMEGYTVKGKDGQCSKGVWRKDLPSCL